ncbi:MAG: hypothetical protein B7Z35_00545 [Hydrogenophilales bacterium 12-61-10]|nr:MAG: hypothetical protein B7Z35_00545 [Hydrogenophilales bacterium 12-61-10]OYX32004.1 MAG: hypothetical protein B7Z03_02875 [Hydrogenophilales bacterium 32-62-9]
MPARTFLARTQPSTQFQPCARSHWQCHATRPVDAVSAQAFTVGKHHVFCVGTYASTRRRGQRLPAHELATPLPHPHRHHPQQRAPLVHAQGQADQQRTQPHAHADVFAVQRAAQ